MFTPCPAVLVRALVIDRPGQAAVRDVAEPELAPGDVIVDVELVGLCGTDVELFWGTMPYLHDGSARYPLRPGHEWCGVVRRVGPASSGLAVGDLVVGDTFLGCGRCGDCTAGRHYLCPSRRELGVRGDVPGALAERLAVPATALHRLPAGLPPVRGVFVEPGSCALRGVVECGSLPGAATLIWGAGTLGLLAALFVRIIGGVPCLVVTTPGQRALAGRLGITEAVFADELGQRTFEHVLDASGAADAPGLALSHVRPGGSLALLGIPAARSALDVARIVLNDITVRGVLGGSSCIDQTIELLRDPRATVESLVAARVRLDDAASALAQRCRYGDMSAPKTLVDPSA